MKQFCFSEKIPDAPGLYAREALFLSLPLLHCSPPRQPAHGLILPMPYPVCRFN
jgi:hypothetical protein